MEKEQKLKELALSVLDSSRELVSLQNNLGLTKDQIMRGYLFYNLNVNVYSNEVYELLGTRFVMYLQNFVPETWHKDREDVILSMIQKLTPKSIVDLGFGVPGKYLKEYVFKNDCKVNLVDFHQSAFEFAEKVLDSWKHNWKENVSFTNLNLNSHKYVGDYDCYLLLDSVEHINNSFKYLKKTVASSLPGSKFILSIPVGPKIPSHTIEWKSEKEVVDWLDSCGLLVSDSEKVYPNPKVDLFVDEVDGEIFNLIVTCHKKYDIGKLPLLDKVQSYDKNFENTLLIVCHHVLKSNLILLDYLIKSGVKSENIYLIGKSYSTSKDSLRNYKKLGINISEKSLHFDSHEAFDEQFSRYVKEFLDEVQSKDLSGYDRILVLDDGGELLLQANERFKDDSRVVGVEQTSSGYNKLKKVKLNFPVVSVARSNAKLKHETPFIIEAISRDLNKRLRQIDRSLDNVLIMGNGPIGQVLANEFKNNCNVYIYDIDQSKSNVPFNEFLNVLSKSDLVVGCTGAVSLPEKYHSYLKQGVILVSASSSDREFDSHKIRIKHPRTSNTHKDFFSDEVILLNGGFPLNFDGHTYSVLLEQIQITEALMYAGAVQALNCIDEPGIVELDSNMQNFIIESFEDIERY